MPVPKVLVCRTYYELKLHITGTGKPPNSLLDEVWSDYEQLIQS